MKNRNKYIYNQKIRFAKKYQVSNYTILDNILIKKIYLINRRDWRLLRSWNITNGIGNFLIPKFFRNLLVWLFPFIKDEIHDLNYAIGGGLFSKLYADWGILKYGIISIYKHFKNGYYLMGFYSILGIPVMILFLLIVLIFGNVSFNFIKIK